MRSRWIRPAAAALLAAVAGGISCSSNSNDDTSGPTYGSCGSTCADLQFSNTNHTASLYVTVVTGAFAAQKFGPLPTSGAVYTVKTNVALGQVFTFSGSIGNSAPGTAVNCTVDAPMLPGAQGFGQVLVTASASSGTATIFCAENWQ